MSKILLGFGGPAGVGKDTALAALQSGYYRPRGGRRKSPFTKVSFAEALKAMVEALLLTAGVSHERILDMLHGTPAQKEAPQPELNGRSARYVMQTLGTEWGRKLISDSLWVDITMRRVRQAWDRDEIPVITDVRFPNEIEAVHAHGGHVIWIVRPEKSGRRRVATHASEPHVPLPGIDYTIWNDEELADFQRKVRAVFREIEGKA